MAWASVSPGRSTSGSPVRTHCPSPSGRSRRRHPSVHAWNRPPTAGRRRSRPSRCWRSGRRRAGWSSGKVVVALLSRRHEREAVVVERARGLQVDGGAGRAFRGRRLPPSWRTVIVLKRSDAKTLKSKTRPRLTPPAASDDPVVDSASIPLIRTRVNWGPRPRTEMFLPSPASRASATPGMRWMDSDRLRSGNLPMSSARMLSDEIPEDCFSWRACCRLAGKPVTTTSSTSVRRRRAGRPGPGLRRLNQRDGDCGQRSAAQEPADGREIALGVHFLIPP